MEQHFRAEHERVDGTGCRIECGGFLQNLNVQGPEFGRHPPMRAYRKQQPQFQQQQQPPASFGYNYDFNNPTARHPPQQGYHQWGPGQGQRHCFSPRGALSPLAMPNIPPPPPVRMPAQPLQHPQGPNSFGNTSHMYASPYVSSGLMNGSNGHQMVNGGHLRVEGVRGEGMVPGADVMNGKGSWYNRSISQPPLYQNSNSGISPGGPNMMMPPPPPLQMMQQGFGHSLHCGEPGQGPQGPHMQQTSFVSVPAKHVGTQFYPTASVQAPQHQAIGHGAPPPMPPPPPPPRPIQIPEHSMEETNSQPADSGSRSPTINYQPPPPHKAPAPIGTPLPGSYMQKATKIPPQARPASRAHSQQSGHSPTLKQKPGPQESRPASVPILKQEVHSLVPGFTEKLDIQSNGNHSWKDSVSSHDVDLCENTSHVEKGGLTKRQKTRLRKKMREAHMKSQSSQKKAVL